MNKSKKKTKSITKKKKHISKKSKKWSKKYKNSINCKKPKGISQKQYCKYGRKKSKRKNKKKTMSLQEAIDKLNKIYN